MKNSTARLVCDKDSDRLNNDLERFDKEFSAIGEMYAVIRALSPAQIRLLAHFGSQISVSGDDEEIETFLKWSENPVMESIMQMVAELDEDDRDQVLFFVEEVMAEKRKMTGVPHLAASNG